MNGTDRLRPGPLERLLKSCDHTGIDKGSQHTKQIQPEMIQVRGRTIHYENLALINSIWKGRKSLNIRKSRSLSLSYMRGDGEGVVITKASLLSND